MKIYFAAPLFSQSELEFNEKVASALRNNGYEVFLPQEGEGIKEKMTDPSTDKKAFMTELFLLDIEQIESSDILLLVMDGRVPDEGACFELGYAYAKGKRCIGLKTDIRVSEYGMDNAMLTGSLGQNIAGDIESLLSIIGADH